jgi:hypothetical protein
VDNFHGLKYLETLILALLTKAAGVKCIIRKSREEATGTLREEAVEAQLRYFDHNIERIHRGSS